MKRDIPANLPINLGDLSGRAHKEWLEEVRDRARLHERCFAAAFGEGDRILDLTETDNLKVLPENPVSMKVVVGTGIAIISDTVFELPQDYTTPLFTAPGAGSGRIDLIEVDQYTQAIVIKAGTEAASPMAPTLDDGCIALALIYHRNGETSIKDTDDGTNGYIFDMRSPLGGSEAVQRDLEYIIYGLYGSANGVLGYGATPTNALKVQATNPVSLKVEVLAGVAVADGRVFRLAATHATQNIPAPSGNPRIDRIECNLALRTIVRKVGTEAASPSAPSLGAGCISLATVYCRVGMVSVKNSNDGTNAYITDDRTFLNL